MVASKTYEIMSGSGSNIATLAYYLGFISTAYATYLTLKGLYNIALW